MWLMPNQRKAMLRTSPFLVLYAQLLLLVNYIYCMDLPEIPDSLPHVNLRDIGLVKISHMAIESIVVKVCLIVLIIIMYCVAEYINFSYIKACICKRTLKESISNRMFISD